MTAAADKSQGLRRFDEICIRKTTRQTSYLLTFSSSLFLFLPSSLFAFHVYRFNFLHRAIKVSMEKERECPLTRNEQIICSVE